MFVTLAIAHCSYARYRSLWRPSLALLARGSLGSSSAAPLRVRCSWPCAPRLRYASAAAAPLQRRLAAPRLGPALAFPSALPPSAGREPSALAYPSVGSRSGVGGRRHDARSLGSRCARSFALAHAKTSSSRRIERLVAAAPIKIAASMQGTVLLLAFGVAAFRPRLFIPTPFIPRPWAGAVRPPSGQGRTAPFRRRSTLPFGRPSIFACLGFFAALAHVLFVRRAAAFIVSRSGCLVAFLLDCGVGYFAASRRLRCFRLVVPCSVAVAFAFRRAVAVAPFLLFHRACKRLANGVQPTCIQLASNVCAYTHAHSSITLTAGYNLLIKKYFPVCEKVCTFALANQKTKSVMGMINSEKKDPWWVICLKAIVYIIGLVLAGIGTDTAAAMVGIL